VIDNRKLSGIISYLSLLSPRKFREEVMDALGSGMNVALNDGELNAHEPRDAGATIGAVDPVNTDRKVGELARQEFTSNELLDDDSPTAEQRAWMRSLGWRADGNDQYGDIQDGPPAGRIVWTQWQSRGSSEPEDTSVSSPTTPDNNDQCKKKKKKRKKKKKKSRSSPESKHPTSGHRKSINAGNPSPVQREADSRKEKAAGKPEAKSQEEAARLKKLVRAARTRAKGGLSQVEKRRQIRLTGTLNTFTSTAPEVYVSSFNDARRALINTFRGDQVVTREFDKMKMESLFNEQVSKFESRLVTFYEKAALSMNLTSRERRPFERSDWKTEQIGIFREGLKCQIELKRLRDCGVGSAKQTHYDFSGDMREEAINMMVMAQKVAYSRHIYDLAFLSEARLESYLQRKFDELFAAIEESNLTGVFDFLIEVLEFKAGAVRAAQQQLAQLSFAEREGSVEKMDFMLRLISIQVKEFFSNPASRGVEYVGMERDLASAAAGTTESISGDDDYLGVD
jgi:hypothetical protein